LYVGKRHRGIAKLRQRCPENHHERLVFISITGIRQQETLQNCAFAFKSSRVLTTMKASKDAGI